MSKRLTDKELIKFSNIIGVNAVINLYVEDKIILTAKQLDRMIAFKNGDAHTEKKNKEKENK